MANVARKDSRCCTGDTARMTIDSRNGTGTLVRLRLPILPGGFKICPQRFTKNAPSRSHAVKLLIVRNDFCSAETCLGGRSALFSHGAQASFILEDVNGVACHGLDVAHVSQESALFMVDQSSGTPPTLVATGTTSHAIASSAARPKDSSSLGISRTSEMPKVS